MANLNRIILVGRLTGDPDTKSTVEGIPMTKFRLAVNRFRKEGSPQAADFIDVVTWRRLAEICGEYLKKGRLVLVEGRIQVRSYEDQAGQRKWATEVVARNMQMLGSNGKKAGAGEPAGPGGEEIAVPSEEVPEEESDLPF
jgi:single-strand DNA-binding protein